MVNDDKKYVQGLVNYRGMSLVAHTTSEATRTTDYHMSATVKVHRESMSYTLRPKVVNDDHCVTPPTRRNDVGS